MSQLPAVTADYSLADDPRPTVELSPQERVGRLSQEWGDYERTANPRTLRTYQAGIDKLVAWHDANGLSYDFPQNPIHPRTLAAWIDDRGEALRPASTRTYLAGINKMHVLAGYPAPAATLPVQNAVKRLVDDLGGAQRQAAPLRYEALAPVLSDLDAQGAAGDLMALRDAALISVAYDTLCRRSEIAALDVSDVIEGPDGHAIIVRRSKTDQDGKGQTRFIAADTFQRIAAFLSAATVEDGALFFPMSAVERDTVGDRLQGVDVARIIKRRCGQEFTGHSTRVGAVQDQLAANVDTARAMQSGGWKSPAMVARYGEALDAQRSGAAVVAKMQGRA